MAIPKVIHYCWFGRTPLPASAERCMESWKKYCPDYEILQWNEENFDVRENRYAREAYEAKKWAFVTDYARLKILYEYGGIYLDTDVELLKPLDDFLEFDGFMGFQADGSVATGLGFGAVKYHELIRELLEDYKEIPFIYPDNSYDRTACPVRNTKKLCSLGLEADNQRQSLMGMEFFPSEFFSPKDYYTGKIKVTDNTCSIHHYDSSWLTEQELKNIRIQRRFGNRLFGYWLKIKRLMGEKGEDNL